MEISEEDLQLINALQIAPRISWSDAAGILGVHATTLAARWERLRASGAAWSTAHLMGDPKQMCLALVDVDCEMKLRADVTAALAAIPEVVTVEEAASNRDLMLTVITPTLAQFSDIVVEQLKEIPGLTKYQTALCTRLHSGGYAWRLNVLDKSQHGRAPGAGRARGRRPGNPGTPGCAAAAEPPGPDPVPGQGRARGGCGHRPRPGAQPGHGPAPAEPGAGQPGAVVPVRNRAEVLGVSGHLPVVRQRSAGPARGRRRRAAQLPQRDGSLPPPPAAPTS